MSGWIIVDKRVSREQSRTAVYGDKSSMRYYGRNGWGRTVKEAVPFASKLDCDELLGATWQAIRRVVSAGTKRARPAAQAAEDNAATLRAELDGLRATDEEMAARLATVTAERDAAVRDLAELRRAIEVLIAQARVT